MPTQNRTRYAILGLLTQCSKTGYDIRKELAEHTSHFWSESLGQVYPTLKRLHHEGLVVRDFQKPEGRPGRILYSITTDGRAELGAWLLEPSRPQPVRNEMLLKLYFASPEQTPAILDDIRAHKARYRALAAQFESHEPRIRESAATTEQERMWSLNLSLGRRIVDARIDWCEEAIDVLTEIAREVDE